MDDNDSERVPEPRARHDGWRIAFTVPVFLAAYAFSSLILGGLLAEIPMPEAAFQIVALAASLLAAGGASLLFWRGTRSRTQVPSADRRAGPTSATSGRLAGRIGGAVFVFVATLVVVVFASFSLSFLDVEPRPFVLWGVSLGCAVTTSVAWWRWHRAHGGRSERPGPLARILSGAVAVGAVAFLLGFVGPMIFTPESNQGPLLGFLFTGPLGFFLGAIGGYVYWLATRKRVTAVAA